MWPLLRAGYSVWHAPVSEADLRLGDIVILQAISRDGFRHRRVHRLIGRIGPYFLEAGDNGVSAALVSAERIVGRVERAADGKGKPVKLPPYRASARDRLWNSLAYAFVFSHEAKDRVLGDRRSPLLWKAAHWYRRMFSLAGLEVPLVWPR